MQVPIVFFDCDGVLTLDSLWSKLHKAVGLPEDLDKKWFDEYYSGTIDYRKWVQNIEDFYRKQKLYKTLFNKTLSKITINSEAKEIVHYLKKKDIKVGIISSGIDYYVEKVAKMLGVDFWKANATFHFDNKGFFSKIDYVTDDPTTKVLQIKEICSLLNVKPTETIFIGDSANDLKAFEFTSNGVLYKSKNEAYRKKAWKTVESLLELKDLV